MKMKQFIRNFAFDHLLNMLLYKSTNSFIILGLMFMGFMVSTCTASPPEYTTKDGTICYKCEPGFFKKADCVVAYHTASCTPCPLGTYQNVYNTGAECANCSPGCDENEEVLRNCSKTNNLQCQCVDGYFNESIGGERFRCHDFQICPKGEGVIRPGTKTYLVLFLFTF